MIKIVPWVQHEYQTAWARCMYYATKDLQPSWSLSDYDVVECFKQAGYNFECVNTHATLYFDTEEDLLMFKLKWG